MAARPSHLYRTNYSYAVILLLLAAVPARSQNLPIYSFSYVGFDKSDEATLKVLGSASINSGAIQLTADTSNSSGRVLFSRSFRLWHSDKTFLVASFNTSFLVNIYRLVNESAAPAEGLAFVIAPDLEPPASGSEGGHLGLTTTGNDGSSDNRLVAVELDTFQQDSLFDPDGNHVGLDINSVRSVATASLNITGIELSPADGKDRNVWIEYDGRSQHIAVYVAVENAPKPQSPVLVAALDISMYIARDSYFGFAGSTGNNIELNCIKQWNLSVEIIPVQKRRKTALIGLPIGFGVGMLWVVYVGSGTAVWYLISSRREKEIERVKILRERLESLPGTPREFRYKELKKATGNFSESNKLGQGSSGVVYKGNLDGYVGEVAVKVFLKESKFDNFLNQFTIINSLRHRYLVRLFGLCYRKGKCLLVYEFLPGGSLDWHLYKSPADSILQWNRRYTILASVASALIYLHNVCDQKVVHRDLKSSKILLDSQYNTRIGLAGTIEPERTSYADDEHNGVPGTIGFIAPECFHTGKATRESDVYSFGSVVLEVVCGRHPASIVDEHCLLVNWVWMLHWEGRLLEAVDGKLQGAFDAAEAERLLMLGLACCHPIARERPKTNAIVKMINGSVPLPVVPLSRPDFVYPGLQQIEVDGGMPGFNSSSPLLGNTVGASTS